MTSQVSPLVLLMQLAERVRQAETLAELQFVMVNETHALAPYRQAVLWKASGVVASLSGIPDVDFQAPFVLWLRRLFLAFGQGMSAVPVLMDGPGAPDGLHEGWEEWLPQHAIALPLKVGDTLMGWLLLARDIPFDEAESQLLAHLAGVYAHAWSCHLGRRRTSWWKYAHTRSWKVVVVVVLGLLMSLRIPLTVLAPAEVVPSQPEVVRAPMEGVVERFHVEPNGRVVVGQLLFELDDTTLKSRLDVAQKSLAIAESEYHVTSQLALQDPKSKAQLAILSGRTEEKKLEAEGLRDLLERCQVRATRPGIALFSDPQSWIGRPVVTGEKILTIAEEREVEAEAWLAPGDLIPLPADVSMTLFLNVDPLHPLSARMRLLAYDAQMRPDGTVAYQLRAIFKDQGNLPRLGLKGIARIEGEDVSVLWWMVRRPVAMVRQWLGH